MNVNENKRWVRIMLQILLLLVLLQRTNNRSEFTFDFASDFYGEKQFQNVKNSHFVHGVTCSVHVGYGPGPHHSGLGQSIAT